MKTHLRATTRGNDPVTITFGNSSMQSWDFHQLHIHCQATFTDPSTVTLYFRNHESTVYDSVLLQTSVSTVDGVLNDIFYVPERPISFTGKDKLAIIFTGVSSALQWAYNAVVKSA